MKLIIKMALIGLVLLIATGSVGAVSLGLHSSNVGISQLRWSASGTTINIWEDWTIFGRGFIEFSGLTQGTNYTVNLNLTNLTGEGWTNFSNELLDPSGGSQDLNDIRRQPLWIPDGFSTSNNSDMLSFSQGSAYPRLSDQFGAYNTMENNGRDNILFYNGYVGANGGVDFQTFSIQDDGYNQSFLLAQSANDDRDSHVNITPEPGTLMLLGLGLIGGVVRKRFQK